MSTLFDKITWKILSNLHSSCKPPKPDYKNPINPMNPINNSVFTSTKSDEHPPLRSHTHFIIDTTDITCININFKDAPLHIKNIWDNAQDVYFDKAFNAFRGQLMYNKNTGEAANYFGSHFVIAYKGRMGTGGSAHRMSINLFDERDIDIPTSDIIIMCGPGGTWPADSDFSS